MAAASCVNLYTGRCWFDSCLEKLNIHHSTIQRWWWRRRMSSASYNYAQLTWFDLLNELYGWCCVFIWAATWHGGRQLWVMSMTWTEVPKWASFTSRTMSQCRWVLTRTCDTHEIKASSLTRSPRPTSFAMDSIRSRLHWWAVSMDERVVACHRKWQT